MIVVENSQRLDTDTLHSLPALRYPPRLMLSAAELLTFLSRRGGQEYQVRAALRLGRGRKATLHELGEYRLTVRGEQIQATGPSGQTRLLTPNEFGEVFGTYTFTALEPTGTLTDLGPLFG